LAPTYSNWRADRSLDEYLRQNGIIGIEGIDTRALTRMLREKGAMRGVLWSDSSIRPAEPDRTETWEKDPSPLPLVSQATLRPEYGARGKEGVPSDEELVELARRAAGMAGADWVQAVKPDRAYSWSAGPIAPWELTPVEAGPGLRVVAIDCGAKQNILRHLRQRGVEVIALPADATAEQILAQKPDGLFISNGPGDPAVLDYAIRPIAALVGKVPIFGICLGQQLLGRALGASTFKLKFGHRGANQPVMNLPTGRVEITSQNHGFAVDQKSLEANGGIVTHVNLNDGTVEGFRHRELPLFCVQYHPEASPGPHDAVYLFDAFIEMMRTGKAPSDARLKELQRMREPKM
jgi:carbamoyl-phosphate synthase small subunit